MRMTYTCDFCGARSESWEVDSPDFSIYPAGWRKVNEQDFCSRCKVRFATTKREERQETKFDLVSACKWLRE